MTATSKSADWFAITSDVANAVRWTGQCATLILDSSITQAAKQNHSTAIDLTSLLTAGRFHLCDARIAGCIYSSKEGRVGPSKSQTKSIGVSEAILERRERSKAIGSCSRTYIGCLTPADGLSDRNDYPTCLPTAPVIHPNFRPSFFGHLRSDHSGDCECNRF